MRVGTICYATEQGIGYLPKDFYDAGVITDVMVFLHGSRKTHLEWYPPGTVELVQRPFSGPRVESWLRSIDVLLQFETPFDWNVLNLARQFGVRTCIVPMYECTPATIPVKPDRWLCPSELDCQYFPGSPYVPIPVKQDWHLRFRARRFLHNGGNLGLREHKGTRQILEALKLVTKPVHLTVRAQDVRGLRQILEEVFDAKLWGQSSGVFDLSSERVGWRLSAMLGSVHRGQLFAPEFDAFVMAEKYNGLSLPIQEAYASGMLVMTSDRFPMNTWLPRWPLFPVSQYIRARVGGPYNEYDEAVLEPAAIAAKLDEVFNAPIDAYSLEGYEWAQRNSWAALKPKWLEALS